MRHVLDRPAGPLAVDHVHLVAAHERDRREHQRATPGISSSPSRTRSMHRSQHAYCGSTNTIVRAAIDCPIAEPSLGDSAARALASTAQRHGYRGTPALPDGHVLSMRGVVTGPWP